MAEYSFKREAQIYVVFFGEKYRLFSSDVNFSQNLITEEINKKTLQQINNLFPGIKVDEAAPATFDLTIYAIREKDYKVIFQRALDCEPFDLYIVTNQDTFKLESCVITNLNFILDKNRALGFSYAGQASKLTREGDETFTVPGTLVPAEGTRTFNILKYSEVILGTTELERLRELSVELQNNIKWLSTDVVKSCTEDALLYYPSGYVVDKKILAGTITSNRIGGRDWSTNESLRIRAGELVGSTVYGFDFDIDEVAFTNRENSGNIFSQSFDWRMVQNPDSLSEVIEYVTYPVSPIGAILDWQNLPILDYKNEAILESP